MHRMPFIPKPRIGPDQQVEVAMHTIDQPSNPAAAVGLEIVKPPPATPPPAPVSLITTGQTAEPTEINLAATVLAERARWRTRGRLHGAVARLARRRRLSPRIALTALTAEDEHAGGSRDPARKTHVESMLQAVGKQAADTSLARAQRGLDRRARKADRLRAKQARLRIRAEHRARDRVQHPDGGQDTAQILERDGTALRAQIAAERAGGSRKHGHLPKWIRHIPQLVLVVDFAMLLYFFAGVTDVDWSSPVSADLGFAVLLGAMVTTLSYGFLAFTGYRLRSFKDHSGAIARYELDGLTRAACCAAAGGALVIATLMFIRMRVEVLYALGPQGWVTADVIAVVLAVVSMLANFLVVLVHALDGSDEMARLDAICASASRPLGRAHRMREKSALVACRVAVQQRRADRQAVRAITRAGRHLAVPDLVIEGSRAVHQGAGPHAGQLTDPNDHDHATGYLDDGPRPAADLRPLRQALEHVSSPLPEIPAEAREAAS